MLQQAHINNLKIQFINHWKPTIAFLGLEIADVLTTRIGVNLGADEMNPLFSVVGLSLTEFLLVKMVVVLLITVRIAARGISKVLGGVIFSIMGLVVALNLTRIILLIISPELDSLLWL